MTVTTIDKSMMNTHNTYPPAKALPIDHIVIHYTAGVTSRNGAARNTLAYFNSIDYASADFCIDDANIMQYADYEKGYRSWHAGNYNMNYRSIGIEICSTNATGKATYANDTNWSFTDAVIDNAVWLVRKLLKDYPGAKIVRHFDCNLKPCPGVPGWGTDGKDDPKWRDFLRRCTENIETSTVEETAKEETKTEEPVKTDELYRVRKTWEDYKSQIGAYRVLDNAIANCKEGYSVFDSAGKKVYPFESYIVKVTVDALNVRTKPDPTSTIVKTITDYGRYTIVEESQYDANNVWGKLKSGAGWINLNYTKKV